MAVAQSPNKLNSLEDGSDSGDGRDMVDTTHSKSNGNAGQHVDRYGFLGGSQYTDPDV